MTAPRPDLADVFADALALPEGERAAFLDAACAGDAAMRAELDDLLGVHRDASRLFRAAASSVGVEDAAAAVARREVGRTLGAYRVTAFLALGGMGEVYLGERTDDAYTKQVAIKLLRPSSGTQEILTRFRTERQVLAGLEHPGIARLIDGGSTPEGQPYLIMEYIDGVPLDRYCESGRLDLGARLRLFLDVCDAVHYAHQNLVVHRDLKPANILVDRSGRPKLLDFGIAKVVDPAQAFDAHATMLRAWTPRYASPEQVRGERITTETDVYSLGVILYELLTGAPPYETAQATLSAAERAICDDAPVPPRRRVPRLAGDLECILLRALQKEPARRYGSVEEFAADIRRHLAGQTVLARPDSVAYRLSLFARRNRAVVASAVAILLTLAVALVFTARAYRAATRDREEARIESYANALSAAEAALGAGRTGEAAQALDAVPSAQRGWEWRHLHARLDRSVRGWKAHDGGITRLAVLGRGESVLTSSIDHTVQRWDVARGVAMRSWGPFPSEVESVAADSAGTLIVAGRTDGEVDILGDTLTALPASPAQWAEVAVSRDGALIAAGYFSGVVRVWDGHTHAVKREWQAHERLAFATFTPSGDLLLTGGTDGLVKAWDARTFVLRATLAGHSKRVYQIAVSGDGRRAVSGSMDHVAITWDLTTMTRLATFAQHTGTVSAVALNADGSRALTAAGDGRTFVWDATSGSSLTELRGPRADVSAVTWIAGDTRILTADWDGGIREWRGDTQDVTTLSPPHAPWITPHIRAASLDAGGRLLVTSDDTHVVTLWDARDRRARTSWSDEVFAVAADDRHRRMVGGSATGWVAMRRVSDGAVLGSAQVHRGVVRAIALTPDAAQVISGGEDGLVAVTRTDQAFTHRALGRHRGAVHALACSPDGRSVVSCAADSTVRVWPLVAGVAAPTLPRFGADVLAVAFAPDGRSFATATRSGVVQLWSAATGDSLARFDLGTTALGALAFSHDGTRLAAGGGATTIRILDVPHRRALVALHGHIARLTSLAFTPNDATLISTAVDGTVRWWDSGTR